MTSLNLIPQQFNVRINPSKSDASRELDNSRRGEPNLPEGGELGEAGTDDSASRSSTWSLTLSSTPVFLSLRPLRFYPKVLRMGLHAFGRRPDARNQRHAGTAP